MERKPTKPDRTDATPDLGLWRRMLHVSDLFRRVVEKDSDRENLNRITLNQARVFGYIFSREKRDIRISDLARDLDVSAAAAGQAVDRLVRAGLVDRDVDPTDRRAFVISVSQAGRARLRDYHDRCREVSGEILAGTPPADLAAFDRVLSAICDGLSDRWERILAARESSAT